MAAVTTLFCVNVFPVWHKVKKDPLLRRIVGIVALPRKSAYFYQFRRLGVFHEHFKFLTALHLQSFKLPSLGRSLSSFFLIKKR